MNSKRSHKVRYREIGFSLVEVMIALVIGLITVLVVTQVIAMSAAQRLSLIHI